MKVIAVTREIYKLPCRMTRRISLLLVALVCSSLLVIVRSDEDVVVGEEEESGGGGGGSEGRKTEGRPVYKPPSRPTGDVYLEESFTDSKAVKARWIKSKAKKDGADADIAKYDGELVHSVFRDAALESVKFYIAVVKQEILLTGMMIEIYSMLY